jgi:hypothetical protein
VGKHFDYDGSGVYSVSIGRCELAGFTVYLLVGVSWGVYRDLLVGVSG